MSLGKLPGIKGLVSGSQGKRRFKSELSVDMISPPLGDFRHTMHVGRGGDVFGDTSFLSSYGGSREPGSPDSAGSSKANGFFARTFRQGWKSSGPRPRGGSRDLASPPPDVSPIIKNAVSLPQLNVDAHNGCLLPACISSTDDSLCTYGLSSGFLTLPRPSRLDRQLHEASLPDGGGFSRSRSDSLTSFTVDLGPSLMTEVLSLIDSSSCLQTFSHHQAAGEEEEEEEEEEEDSSLTDTPVQSPGVTSPSGSFRWTKEDGGSARTPGLCAGSPLRAEPVMEAERFQRAADVLSRHYGGGSFTKGTKTSNNFTDAAVSNSRETSQAFSEEEEEIKV